MEFHWPFAVCISFVVFFSILALFLLRSYEGARVSASCEEVVEDPSMVAIEPIGYLCREELWSFCGGAYNPTWLLLFRALCLLYLLAIFISNVVLRRAAVLFFYTEWTFTLLVVYFALAFRQSLLHYLEDRSMASVNRITPPKTPSPRDRLLDDDEDLETPSKLGAIAETLNQDDYDPAPPLPFARGREKREEAGWEGYVTQCVFQSVLPAAVLTDLVYWGLLVPLFLPPHWHHSFIDLHMHAVNLVVLIIEFAFNSLRFPWFRISYFLLWSTAYVSFQWICHSTGIIRFWPYPFMNVDTPSAPAWYLSIITFHGICYAICLLLALVKQSIWYQFNYPVIGRMSF